MGTLRHVHTGVQEGLGPGSGGCQLCCMVGRALGQEDLHAGLPAAAWSAFPGITAEGISQKPLPAWQHLGRQTSGGSKVFQEPQQA